VDKNPCFAQKFMSKSVLWSYAVSADVFVAKKT